jgi:hypothetical protein
MCVSALLIPDRASILNFSFVFVFRDRTGNIYTLVSSESDYTPIAFDFNAPFGIIFDRFAHQQGRPRLFVIDFHRLIQIDLDPTSLQTFEPVQVVALLSLLYFPQPHIIPCDRLILFVIPIFYFLYIFAS